MEIEAYRLKKYIGAYVAAMSKKKGSVTTTDDSPITVLVIPIDEELVFIEDVAAKLAGDHSDHMNFRYSFAQPEFESKQGAFI